MKGYYPPEKLETGRCFLCNEVCDKDSYCHLGCAIAYSDKKKDLIKQAGNKVKEGE